MTHGDDKQRVRAHEFCKTSFTPFLRRLKTKRSRPAPKSGRIIHSPGVAPRLMRIALRAVCRQGNNISRHVPR
jgi:hypothetical protein